MRALEQTSSRQLTIWLCACLGPYAVQSTPLWLTSAFFTYDAATCAVRKADGGF